MQGGKKSPGKLPSFWHGQKNGVVMNWLRKDGVYLFARAATKQISWSRCLKQQKFIFARSWWLEVWDEDVSSLGFFRGLSPRLADGCVLCVHTAFPFCTCVFCISLSVFISWPYKPTSWYWNRALPCDLTSPYFPL